MWWNARSDYHQSLCFKFIQNTTVSKEEKEFYETFELEKKLLLEKILYLSDFLHFEIEEIYEKGNIKDKEEATEKNIYLKDNDNNNITNNNTNDAIEIIDSQKLKKKAKQNKNNKKMKMKKKEKEKEKKKKKEKKLIFKQI